MTQHSDFNLDRFVDAQNIVWDSIIGELTAGKKRTHWMWFVFPQLVLLGRSPTSRHFGISGLDEASAYLAHALLSSRLNQVSELVLSHKDRSAYEIFGPPDDLKLRSSATLFRKAAPDNPNFKDILSTFFDGTECSGTNDLLRSN